MKYAGMPAGMWLLFSGSFRKQLGSVLEYDARTAGEITSKAKKNTGRSLHLFRSLKRETGSK